MGTKVETIRELNAEQLKVQVYENRSALGLAAGTDAAAKMKQLLAVKAGIRVIFAAAPSQNEMLDTLVSDTAIDWSRVTAFHMDEYIGLAENAPQKFSRFLCERLFDRVQPGRVHLIDSLGDAEAECRRYAGLLAEAPIDMVCLGIGENGHIAFNDPPVANFEDGELVKIVELDDVCRQQQVNDGCFPTFADVPTHAITLTIPALTSGAHLFCSVPGPTKREAVTRTIHDELSTACPSTILRRHGDCTLYADRDSYGS